MQILPFPRRQPFTVDATLVDGLRLPRIPGLPGLDHMGIDPRELVAPPAPGSRADKADRAFVKAAQALRTPAGDEWALRMATDGTTKLWVDLADRMRAKTGVVQGWLGTALLASTMATTAATTWLAKERYDRLRPFQADPKITPAVPPPHGKSYPSGHASAAFAAARVISRLEPTLAREAYGLATQVAVSRVYAGVHYPSDVVAGALLGTGIAEAALRTAGKLVPGQRATLAPAY